MQTSKPDQAAKDRPFLIRQVSQALAVTGLLLLALAFLGFGAMVRGYLDKTLSIGLACVYLMFVVAGGLGGTFHVLMARAFYRLDKVAYEWVHSTSWNPLVAIVTAGGRRLDWPEVREAFGLKDAESAEKKGD